MTDILHYLVVERDDSEHTACGLTFDASPYAWITRHMDETTCADCKVTIEAEGLA